MREDLKERASAEIRDLAIDNLEMAVSLFSLDTQKMMSAKGYEILNALVEEIKNPPLTVNLVVGGREVLLNSSFDHYLARITAKEIKDRLQKIALPKLEALINFRLRLAAAAGVQNSELSIADCAKELIKIMKMPKEWQPDVF